MRLNNFKSERVQEKKADAHKAYADKEARREYLREWKRKNRHRAYMNAYNRAHPEQRKRYQRTTDLRRGYGMTIAQYDAMLEAQNGKCKLCSRVCASGRRLAVDHDHATGRIRGLLCSACNLAVGQVEKVPDWAARVSLYLGVN